MKKFALPLVLALLLAGSLSASAAPSFFGPTGLLEVPTANTLSMGSLNAFGNFINTEGDNTTAFGANIGVGFGLEAGLTVLNHHDSDAMINAKWKFLSETLVTPAIAVGALDITDSVLGVTPYVVASKSLSIPTTPWKISGHLGFAGGDVDQLFAAADAVISAKTTLIAETFDGHFNAGVRYAVTPELRADLAAIDGDFAAALSYSFGLK